jgi:hypothetical protein
MTTTPKDTWESLDGQRSQHLDRSIYCCSLTIPYLLREDYNDDNTPLKAPYSATGASAVTSLASRLLMTLFPPNIPLFKLSIAPAVESKLKNMVAASKENYKTTIEEELSIRERMVTEYIETIGIKSKINLAMELLVATGNAIIHIPSDGEINVLRLDQYVIKRDPSGRVKKIITRLGITADDIPAGMDIEAAKGKYIDTYIELKKNLWHVHQEIAGIEVPKSKGTYKKDDLPWIVLTWSRAVGDNYGRGQVEKMLGDFIAADALSQALQEGAAAAAVVKFLVSPEAQMYLEDLASTPNTGFCVCEPGLISALQLGKNGDFTFASNLLSRIEQRIERSFLMQSGVQRDAERVTSTEIRYMAQELENSLGGVYSTLSQELQLPIIKRIISVMTSRKEIQPIPSQIKPVITTGIEALGRGNDRLKLISFLQALAPLGGEAMQYINVAEVIKRIGTSDGIDMQGLIRTDEELATSAQQAQQAQLLNQVAGPVTKEGVKGIIENYNKQQ